MSPVVVPPGLPPNLALQPWSRNALHLAQGLDFDVTVVPPAPRNFYPAAGRADPGLDLAGVGAQRPRLARGRSRPRLGHEPISASPGRFSSRCHTRAGEAVLDPEARDVNRTTRNLIALTLLMGGVSALSGCTAHGGAGLGQGAIVVAPVIAAVTPVVGILALSPTGPTERQRKDPRWIARSQRLRRQRLIRAAFGAADHWIRDAEAFRAKADRLNLEPTERERYLRKKARKRRSWTKRRNWGELPWRRPPSKNADGLWTFQLLDGQWTVRNAKGKWNARIRLRKPGARAPTGSRRWTLKNESSTPLKVTYATGGTLKSKTLKPGKTLELTTDSRGVSYTLRQGKRKKKGTATPRRGQTVTTVWE